MACLGSGYDFKAEMALGEESSLLSYDLIILHYWKDYVHRHRRVLVKGGIDLTAVKRARSLPVSCAHLLLVVCRQRMPAGQVPCLGSLGCGA